MTPKTAAAIIATLSTVVVSPAQAEPDDRDEPDGRAGSDVTAERRHDDRLRELRAKIEEASLERRYAQIVAAQATDRAAPPERGLLRLRRGRIVFPDLIGLSTTYALAGSVGGVAGLAATGPLTVGAHSGLGGVRSTHLAFQPSAVFLVNDHLTVGGGVTVARSTSTSVSYGAAGAPTASRSEEYSVGLAPRVGYIVPLGRSVLLWPSLELAAARFRYAFEDGTRTLGFRIGAAIDVGVVFPLSEYLFLKVGPSIRYLHGSLEGPGAPSPYTGSIDTFVLATHATLGLAL